MNPLNTIIEGDALVVLKDFADNSIDSIVTDPPAGIGFMGKEWDSDKGGKDEWINWLSSVMKEGLRVLKPSGHALVWALPRTSHWTGTALENAGFEVRDCVYHLFGSGFPKSLDISKAIDKRGGKSVGWFGEWLRNWRKENNITQKEVSKLFPSKTGGLTGCVANWELGLNLPTPEQFNLICKTFNLPFKSLEAAEREIIGQNNFGASSIYGSEIYNNRKEGKTIDITKAESPEAKQWEGWGTALKPAVECWWLVRKPLSENTVAENVLKHGTGGINIDGSRIKGEDTRQQTGGAKENSGWGTKSGAIAGSELGRFPANLIHDGSDVILKELNDEARFFYAAKPSSAEKNLMKGEFEKKQAKGGGGGVGDYLEDVNSSSGKFGSEKAPAKNFHPTVKAQSLMMYLIKLITPPKGIVLDMFAGSGSTLVAAKTLGHPFIGVEIDPEYVKIAEGRLKANPNPLF